jgi:hypothetical protein
MTLKELKHTGVTCMVNDVVTWKYVSAFVRIYLIWPGIVYDHLPETNAKVKKY